MREDDKKKDKKKNKKKDAAKRNKKIEKENGGIEMKVNLEGIIGEVIVQTASIVASVTAAIIIGDKIDATFASWDKELNPKKGFFSWLKNN